ncbi:MAG: response regulator [Candidatus Omnitrophica bacterium]|nr:response regulator [Candidatus Omnitrophota bacterium]
MSAQNQPNIVLVVDDEFGPRQAIRMILQSKYNVLTCDNAREAIDIVCAGAVDVVLLDIKMPEVDGLKLLKQMKAAATDVEIALVTGYPSTQTVIEAMQHGAYDYVIKPFDKKKIEEVVQKGVTLKIEKKSKRELAAKVVSEIFKGKTPNDTKQKEQQTKDYSSLEAEQKAAEEFYATAIETIKTLLAKIRKEEDLNPYLSKIDAILKNVSQQLMKGNALLDNLYTKRSKDEYFLPYHIVNLSILSIFLGINMGLSQPELRHLGMACVFCDTGMDALRQIASQPRRLDRKECILVKNHISKSLKLVRQIAALKADNMIDETIISHHERANGSGYPRGLKSKAINTYAKIIGLADVFEALTHERPHRRKIDAHKTVKLILRFLKNYFDRDIVKLLIAKFSIYPIGSTVRLDTKETAKVIDVCDGSPMRPIVMVLENAFGQPIKERIIVDLSKPNSPSIQGPA